jgi:DNA-binding NarL/FixJ family response regulator
MRVIVVEDSALIREGLTRILADDGMEVVAALSSPEALTETVNHSEPDIVILDIRMPPDFNDEGIRAAHLLRARSPAPGVLLLSQHLDTHSAWELFRDDRGGLGYLLKDRVLDIDEFLDSVRRVAAGGTALDPQVVKQLVSLSEPTSRLRSTLSERERQVLGLMAEGLDNPAIASRLSVGLRTVETHVNRVFTKLGLLPEGHEHRRVAAVLAYLRDAART